MDNNEDEGGGNDSGGGGDRDGGGGGRRLLRQIVDVELDRRQASRWWHMESDNFKSSDSFIDRNGALTMLMIKARMKATSPWVARVSGNVLATRHRDRRCNDNEMVYEPVMAAST